MDHEVGPFRQPGSDNGMLVGSVIVDDQMNRQALRGFPINLLEEPQPFDMGMALLSAEIRVLSR